MSLSINNEFQEELKETFKRLGIKSSDCVLLHSDTTKIFYKYKKKNKNFTYNFFLETILDFFFDGTLLLPTFNFEFCEKAIYDFNNTPSKMGVLSELFRSNNKKLRTSHPVYSFSVFGKLAKKFLTCDNFEAFSDKSPFGKLIENNAKIAIWNLEGQKSMTYYHFIERENKVDYRFDKVFEGIYKNSKNISVKKKFSIFVRDIENNIVTDVNGMENILWAKKVYRGDKFNEGNGMRVANCSEVFKEVSNVIQSNNAYKNLYRKL
jgi:aminoglycoside 3-N-acetyltransferase